MDMVNISEVVITALRVGLVTVMVATLLLIARAIKLVDDWKEDYIEGCENQRQ